MTRVSKTLVAGISALAMAAAVILPATPASAGGWGGGGFHGGGFHGGGWGGGGWHGGGWGGPWFHPWGWRW
jgi:Spy/CpxP family protein refolding chaperone